MTRLEALRALKEAVEAGKFPGGIRGPVRTLWPYDCDANEDYGLTAKIAFDGSLDAARALHEAVLHSKFALAGLHQFTHRWGARIIPDDHMATNECPARAWLLAILSALIAQESANDAP